MTSWITATAKEPPIRFSLVVGTCPDTREKRGRGPSGRQALEAEESGKVIKFRPIALVVLCCALAAPLPMAASVHRFVSAPPVRRSAPPVYVRANPAVRPQARPPMAFRPTPGPRPGNSKGTVAGDPRRVQLAQSVGRPQGIPAAPNQPQGYRMRGPGPHRGDWLRQYGSLPSDQMRRQLEQDKTFQSLPAGASANAPPAAGSL